MTWLWIVGILVAMATISHLIDEAWKAWELRSFRLSPAQRKIVDLRLRQREVSNKMAWSAQPGNASVWRHYRKRAGEIEDELKRLYSTLDEAQLNEVHRAIQRVS